jgi:hypothetical protein
MEKYAIRGGGLAVVTGGDREAFRRKGGAL